MRRDFQINIAVSEIERAAIRQAAKSTDCTVSQLLRAAFLVWCDMQDKARAARENDTPAESLVPKANGESDVR